VEAVQKQHDERYLHAKRRANEVVDGCHLIAVEVNGNQQQHPTE